MQTQQPEYFETISAAELSLPEKSLDISDLAFLRPLGRFEPDRIILEKSVKGYRLKTPMVLDLARVLAVGQKALVEYIVHSLISQRPKLIPLVLENKTLLELANYMLRARSASKMGFYGYTNTVSLYCRRLDTTPDALIADANPGKLPDLERIQKHREFLQRCINELQDLKRSPGRLIGYTRQIRTFYRVNGVEIPKPKLLPRPKVVSKDRAPTAEELQRILDVATLREKVIVCLLALGAFREETLTMLKYSHVKEDLEKNIIPVRIKIEYGETKGDYCDYSTFIGSEAVHYLKLYLEERRRGQPNDGHGVKVPPEEITDDSPLIRDCQSKQPRPIGEKQVYKIVHNLYHKAGLQKKNKNGGYELRAHSIRKFFKTQLMALGVGEAYIDYWMGHKGDTYHDIEMKGIEFLRSLYANARLSIRPETNRSKVDIVKLVRAAGASSEEIQAAFKALSEPHRVYSSPQQRDDAEIEAFTKMFIDKVSDRLKQGSNPTIPGP